jgi:hypothetical protein
MVAAIIGSNTLSVWGVGGAEEKYKMTLLM